MHKILRFSLYLIILLVYNITTLYTSSVHNHNFTWDYEESCSAYVISISQNSDTFPFSETANVTTPDFSVFDLRNYDTILEIEFLCNILERAPPSII